MARLRIAASRQQLLEDGYTVLPEILAPELTAAVRAALEPHFGVEGWGRNEFEGTNTERVYSLLDKCPVVASLVEHEAVLALLDDHLRPSRLLAACQATRVHRGKPPKICTATTICPAPLGRGRREA